MRGRRNAFREKQFWKHLRQLRSDPQSARDRPFTRSPWFGWRLLRLAQHEIDVDAECGRPLAVEAFELFDYIRLLTIPSIVVLRRSNCMAVTSRGLLAATDRRLGYYDDAQSQLDKGLIESESCRSCQVEILWRRGVLYATIGRFQAAKKASLDALSHAQCLSVNTDHNLDHNGTAAALLGCYFVDFQARRYQGAAQFAEEALAQANPEWSPNLYRASLHNLANALTELGGEADLRRAESCLSEAYSFFSSPSPGRNAERATLDFLYGQLRIRQGHEAEGQQLIAKAQIDFVWLKMPREAVIATTVLARWHASNGSKWETENSVADLLVNKGHQRSWHPTFKVLPGQVLGELERVIRLARRGDFEAISASVGRIRDLLKADQMMPCLI